MQDTTLHTSATFQRTNGMQRCAQPGHSAVSPRVGWGVYAIPVGQGVLSTLGVVVFVVVNIVESNRD